MRKVGYALLFLFSACVDPFVLDDEGADRKVLVVDGLITNQQGPYTVRLFYSHRLKTKRLVAFESVVGATVMIIDHDGNSYPLIESSPGTYKTNQSELTGQIGGKYLVSIRTQDEKEYRSDYQEIKIPGDIDNIDFRFTSKETEELENRLGVYIDSRGVAGNENLFRWRWTTIHKTKAYPELKITPTPGGDRPTPEICSGYIYTGGSLVKVGECTCCECWSYNYSDGAHVSKNSFLNEAIFNDQFLGSVPVSSMHFYDKYYIEVQQLSLSQEAYDFWSLVEKQQKGSTDLFQPNAIKIRGNIKSVTNPDEEVLGFFGVSGVVSRFLYIDPSEVPFEFPPIDIVAFSCLDYFQNPTNEKPDFW